ncbi:amidohydrolase family protein [Methylobacterium sp. EM32]|uniref:amidohydrolase family protein n=1 Tax=Methylobacterium sp. EM32 TaxID=3163481 RepID=UPI0033A06C7A
MSRYDGPILDAHQHFWEPDRNPHPWLKPGVRIPFRYGDYEAIKRRYLPDDYRRDAAPHDIVASVYVETEWDPGDPLGETAYAAGLAAEWGLPNAIVAQAWLDRDDVAAVLAGQAACPLVRSVRHKPGGPDSPDAVGRGRTLMSDETWRAGYALLQRHGLRFDLQTPWWNLDEAVALARDFPATAIILNHAGLPARRDPDSLGRWRAALARFAACPNATVKASGLGQPDQAWTPELNGPVVRTLIDLFGADRVMFGSNFPVDSLCAELSPMIDGFKAIVAPLAPAEQEAFFIGTARRVYGVAVAATR